MFKDIKIIKTEEMDENDTFPILKSYRTLIYNDQSDKQIKIRSYLFKEDEKSNYPVKKINKRKQEIETRSHCRKIEIKYDYYETKVYDVNRKELLGKECLVKTDWERK